MKKIVSLVILAGMFAFYACGPSAADKEAAEKAEKAKADSLAGVAKAATLDSVNKINAMKDSIVKAEDAKMAGANHNTTATKPAPKTDNTPTTQPAQPAGGGPKVGAKKPGAK